MAGRNISIRLDEETIARATRLRGPGAKVAGFIAAMVARGLDAYEKEQSAVDVLAERVLGKNYQPKRKGLTVACNLCHGNANGTCERCGGSGRLSKCRECGCLAGRHEPGCKS